MPTTFQGFLIFGAMVLAVMFLANQFMFTRQLIRPMNRVAAA